ncbi:MAG: DNA cytosine methyltransferase [Polyangiaceae bacterium]|nr:DNA cytosine methyltransferase [Polyangiaceae bacterium]
MTKPIAIELCAGMGGIGIALRSLGYEVAGAFDSWGEAVAIYNHNFVGEVAEECNLLTAAGRNLVAGAKTRIGEVDLLAAGPPCKGFSRLRNGRHDGRNGHNRVLAAMPEYVGIIRPRMFLIENVPDLIRHREGKTLGSLLQKLRHPARGLKYSIEYQTYDAAWFGTPQARRRTLILGIRGGFSRPCLPKPGPDLSLLYSALRRGGEVPDNLRQYLAALKDPENGTLTTASQALSDLPVLNPGAVDNEREYRFPARTAFQRWARERAPKKLTDMQTPRVTAEAQARLGYIPPGGCARSIPIEHLNGLLRRYDSAYRKLHPDTPSTALSTRYDCVYHYAKPRSLSVREYARLQGIPDRIAFPSALACRRSAYEMIGNSVPPLLIRGVLSAIVEALDGDST